MKRGRLADPDGRTAVSADGNAPAARKLRAFIDCIPLRGEASLLCVAEAGGVFMNMELGCDLGKAVSVGGLCREHCEVELWRRKRWLVIICHWCR